MEDRTHPSNAFIHRLEPLLCTHGHSPILSILRRGHHAKPLVASCSGRSKATFTLRWCLLPRHNLVLDLLVGGTRKYVLLHPFSLPCIWSPLDDLLGVGIPDPRQSLELLGGGCVDAHEVRNVCGGAGWPCSGNSHGEGKQRERKQQHADSDEQAQMSHDDGSFLGVRSFRTSRTWS